MSDRTQNGPLDHYILYECDGAYLLRSRRSGYLYRVLWSLQSEWGVYVRPEGNITGLHYFQDEIERVTVLPLC